MRSRNFFRIITFIRSRLEFNLHGIQRRLFENLAIRTFKRRRYFYFSAIDPNVYDITDKQISRKIQKDDRRVTVNLCEFTSENETLFSLEVSF